MPEPDIMEEIFKMVEINTAIDLLPPLWLDVVIFDHVNRENLLLRILKIMIDNKSDTKERNQKQLPQQFAKITLDVYLGRRRNQREDQCGSEICGILREVTDDKSLAKEERKRLQIENAANCSPKAKLVKLIDKLDNLRDLQVSLPVGVINQL
uniref:Uncharacterized protein n=1 Tax=Glossina pallidipes TaxID=7398 RepID=A0A1B0AF27_GLOPL